jgi:hypothetical protein
MRRGFRDMNPTLRGFLIIALIALVVVVLQLEATLTALFLLAQIAFFLAIAYFIFLLWRDRRQEISMWSQRSRVVFYGSAVLMVVNVAARFFVGVGNGLNLAVFVPRRAMSVWRDEHSYLQTSLLTAAPSARPALRGSGPAYRRKSACRAPCSGLPRVAQGQRQLHEVARLLALRPS